MDKNKVVCVVPLDVKEVAAFRERKAAKYVGIGINNFRALVHEGAIPARLQGSQRLFLRVDLDAYLSNLPIDAGAVKPTGEGPGLEVRRAPRGFELRRATKPVVNRRRSR